MSEWIELNSIEDVARAKVEGWGIQVLSDGAWVWWGGEWWSNDGKFRGRPKQQEVVVYSCFDVDGRLEWLTPECRILSNWTRIPQFDKIVEAAESGR